ncbi:MAG: DUF1801 domain-containing protein [Chitinophagales bacterium]
MQLSKKVDDYIANADKPLKDILLKLRQLIAEAVPKAKENFKWGQPVYTTEKDFCYLKLNKQHINIGFFNFEKITDPNNLLEGSGKNMRHIKIRSISDIDSSELSKMIKQASTD